MKKIRCISVSVYRDGNGDCSNGGVSSRFRRLLVACPDGPDIFDADKAIPLNFCRVRKRHLFGRDVYDVRPAALDEDGNVVDRGGKWFMFGGNIAFTSDSRFKALCDGLYAGIQIHDRVE